MAKCKTFYCDETEREDHDSKVRLFLEELEECGHTFVNLNTIAFSERRDVMEKFRTEIIYFENPTRKVIFEKTEI